MIEKQTARAVGLEWRNKEKHMQKGSAVSRAASVVLTLGVFITAVSCENPLVEQMQQRIAEDVTVYLAGDAPRVLNVTPVPNASDIPTSAVISAVFDMDLDPATITGSTVTLTRLSPEASIEGTLAYNTATRTASFTPTTRLAPDKSYRLTVTTGLKSAKGAAFGTSFSTTFTTRYFHDDEIGVDLTYSSSDYQLNSAEPILFQVVGLPLRYMFEEEDFITLSSMPVISPTGKYRITPSNMPGTWSEALIVMTHTMLESVETQRLIKIGVPGNSIEEAEDVFLRNAYNRPLIVYADGTPVPVQTTGEDAGLPVAELDGPAFHAINEDYVLTAGNEYTVVYTDGSTVLPDDFENIDILGSTFYHTIGQGVFETRRNLHSSNDVDFIKFTPARTDRYEIRLDPSPNLRVDLNTMGGSILASGTGSGSWTVNPGGTLLTGGTSYYLRINSPTSRLGEYHIGYFLANAQADAAEPNNGIASATSLTLGRANQQTHTFHEDSSSDSDWFALELESGKTYVVEVKEDPSYFGYGVQNRGLKADFRLEWSDGSSTAIYYPLVVGGNTLFIDDPDKWWGGSGWPAGSDGSGTFYLQVANATPIAGEQRPTMQYTILATWGPDVADQIDDPTRPETNEFDLYNEHGPAGAEGTGTSIRYAAQGDQGIRRTIYSVLPSEAPQDDVDWFRIQTRNNLNDYLIWTMPEPGNEGIIVEFVVYKAMLVGDYDLIPDLVSGPGATGQQWSGSQDEPVRGVKIYPGALTDAYTYYPTTLQSTFFVKVRRSTVSNTNPLTGAYRLFFKAGADNEDNQIPDTCTTVGGIQYRLDETPWIGQPNSIDFSTRNKLADRNDWSSGMTPMRLNSIYARNYDHSTGKPLTGVDPYPDHDYLWVEVPAGKTSVTLAIYATYENQPDPGMPIKATVRKAPNISAATALLTIQARDSNSNKVVTEDELVYVGEYTSQSNFLADSGHFISQSITVAGGDVLFVRVERDNVNAGAGDPVTAEYSIRFLSF
jgi:hypothetical protein